MTISSEILALTNRLNQELAQTKQEATEGLGLVRAALSLFPDNAVLIQLFAYLNTTLLFVENSGEKIQLIVKSISPSNVPEAEIQESGEYLATLLGVVLEVKIRVENIITSLE